jgi:peptidoglycan-associated lipoprotein
MKLRTVALVALSLVALASAGCGKKKPNPIPVPPAPTPAPAPAPTPVTPPESVTPPAPAPTPEPAKPAASVSDLGTVYFAYDSFGLDEAARATLDRNAQLLRENTALVLTIEGHCDERGTVEYNQALGEKRAESVKQYLVDANIAADRLRIISYGKERPADEGHDETAWSRNRRCEFAAR